MSRAKKVSKKNLKNWFNTEVKSAYKNLKAAIKSGDEKQILNCYQWLSGTCDAQINELED